MSNDRPNPTGSNEGPNPTIWKIVVFVAVLLVLASIVLVLLPREGDLPLRLIVLAVAVASLMLALLARVPSFSEPVAHVMWAGALTGIPMTFVANLTILVFAWILTSVVAWVIVIVVVVILLGYAYWYVKNPNQAGTFKDAGRAGLGLGSGLIGTEVVVTSLLGLVGCPVPAPECSVIDSIKSQLESGLVPIIPDADLECLRREFIEDALPHIVTDTLDPERGALHPRSHDLSNLQVYHHEDSTRLIPGPGGDIRPIERAYLNTKRTLPDGRWVHWTNVDSLGLGLPGLNIPAGISYALLIKIDSTANVERLIEALREHKNGKIDSVWSQWHDAVAHDHLSEITPLPPEDIPDGSRAVNYRYRRGELIKLYVPARGNDYRFNLIRYYESGTNFKDQALWLEHSHFTPCVACETHGWCSDE